MNRFVRGVCKNRSALFLAVQIGARGHVPVETFQKLVRRLISAISELKVLSLWLSLITYHREEDHKELSTK